MNETIYYNPETDTFDVGVRLAAPLFPDKPQDEGRSPLWRALQKKIVAAHPFCSVCGDKSSLQVHHRMPFHLNKSLELLESNLVVLCQRDHFTIGHLFDWRGFNSDVDKDILIWNKKLKERSY